MTDRDNLLIRSEVKQAGAEVLPVGTHSLDAMLSAGAIEIRGVSEAAAEAYRTAYDALTAAVHAVEAESPVPVQSVCMATESLVQAVGRDRSILILAMDRGPSFSFRQHSVNVAIIATRMAMALNWSQNRLVAVALAGMLHDIGTVRLPRKLLFKMGGFTPSERKEIEKRPLYSAELLGGFAGYEWLPTIVSQVYERENGRGYPRGMRGADICEEAKVLGIADVFEACLHRRPQRAGLTGYQALEVITSESDTFAERITKAMIRSFSVYPFNEFVVLNTGEVAVVTDINEQNPLRPVIRITHAADGHNLSNPRTVDLSQNAQLWITLAIASPESVNVV